MRELMERLQGVNADLEGFKGLGRVTVAERGSERIIATVFGGKSSSSRNAQVANRIQLHLALGGSFEERNERAEP